MSLNYEDLKGSVIPEISVDEFEPKAGSGKEVIVVAFYLVDKEPAEDLNTYIQRSFLDTLDVEVSPNTDENGNYLVFVEMNRNSSFLEKFKALVKDVENVSGKQTWKIHTYMSADRTFEIEDPALFTFIEVVPMKESIEKFLKETYVSHLTVDGDNVILQGSNFTISATVADVGEYQTVINRNMLSESAFNVIQSSTEVMALNTILGNCEVLPIGKFISINKDDNIVLLKNTQLEYGKR